MLIRHLFNDLVVVCRYPFLAALEQRPHVGGPTRDRGFGAFLDPALHAHCYPGIYPSGPRVGAAQATYQSAARIKFDDGFPYCVYVCVSILSGCSYLPFLHSSVYAISVIIIFTYLFRATSENTV